MEELFFGFLALSIAVLLFGGAVLGVVSFFRDQTYREEVSRLKDLSKSLQLRISKLEEQPFAETLINANEETESQESPQEDTLPELGKWGEVSAKDDSKPLKESAPDSDSAVDAPVKNQKIETHKPLKEANAPKAPQKRIEWEKLLGVRGAAILGGVALVIAAILFYQHAVQEGWFGMRSRVWTGAIVGTACFLLQSRLRTKGYIVVANVLGGSGAVIHYAAAWAAFRLYHLISLPGGFGWMALTTAACCLLAVRHSSQLIAIFGLIGGFATPLLLTTNAPSALGLFGYILILNVSLLAIGRKQDWPWLSLLGLFGTTSTQLLWLVKGREEDAAIALFACGVFGVLYVVMAGPKTSNFGARWQLGQVAGVLIPFAIATHYARVVELGDNLGSIAFIAALLAGAASFSGRKLALPALPIAGAAGAAAVTSTWLLTWGEEDPSLYLFALFTGAISLVLIALNSWYRRGETKDIHPAAAHSLILLLTFALLTSNTTALSLWDVSLMVLIHVGVTIYSRSSLPALLVFPGLIAGLTFSLFHLFHAHPANPNYHNIPSLIGVVILTSSFFLASALTWRRSSTPRSLALAAVLCVLPFFFTMQPWFGAFPPLYYGAVIALTAIACCGAVRSQLFVAYAAVALLTSWLIFEEVNLNQLQSLEWSISSALLGNLCVLGTLVLTPLLFKASLEKTRLTGFFAAFAPFLGVASFLELHEHQFGERGSSLVFLGLAVLPSIAYLQLRRREAKDALHSSATDYLMAALFFVAFAVPAELRNISLDLRGFLDEWFQAGISLAAIAWSMAAIRRGSERWQLAALALACLPGLYWTALYIEIGLFKREPNFFLNWFSYHYVLTFLGLFVSLRNSFNRKESATSSNVALLKKGLVPLSATLSCLLPFVWINLTVINAYAINDNIELSINDVNGELVRSFSWAIYAFLLLMIGTKKKITALRWASLGFFFITIGKVFLGDLGDLEGLQRISSFLGLAVCLILVSLFYSRFVFKGEDAEGPSA